MGNDTSSCTSSNIGTLRYNNGSLQICKNNAWTDSGSRTQNSLNVSSNFTLGTDYLVTYVDSSNNPVPVPSTGGFTIYRFFPTTTKAGSVTTPVNLSIQFLIVTNNNNSNNNSDNGGSGGFRTGTGTLLPIGNYGLQIGGGGAGGASANGTSGTDSYLGMDTSSLTLVSGLITSAGGGGGAGTGIGLNGGSGGGSLFTSTTAGLGNTPSTTRSQGNNGRAPNSGGGTNCGGGGGGAGQAGGIVPGNPTGFPTKGGDGSISNITGTSVYYAGGGGSGNAGQQPVALGGGGLGGGGGGGTQIGGKGGAGVVIIRFPSYN